MKINFNKIKKLGKNRIIYKFSISLAKHPILSCLALLFIACLLSFLIFYRYNVQSRQIEGDISDRKSVFKDNIYEKILKIREEQERKIKAADSKEYKNPFQTATP